MSDPTDIPSLSPCPFCGSPAMLKQTNITWVDDIFNLLGLGIPSRFWIQCEWERCPVMMKTGYFDSAEQAVISWSKRV